MNLTVDISVRDLLTQMLEYNSLHSLLYFLGEIERAPDAEEWANACTKLLDKGEEQLTSIYSKDLKNDSVKMQIIQEYYGNNKSSYEISRELGIPARNLQGFSV